jgi:hypothetical protein
MFDAAHVVPTSSITVATIFSTFRATTVFLAFPWLALSIFGATRLDTKLVKPSMPDAFPWASPLSIFGTTRLDTELATTVFQAFPRLSLRKFGTARFNTFSVSTIFGLYIWFIKHAEHLIQSSLLTHQSVLSHSFGVHFDKQLVNIIRFKYFIFLQCKEKPAKKKAR